MAGHNNVTAKCLNVSKAKSKSTSSSNHVKFNLTQLRWDKGDKDSFYYYTGHNLLPLIDVVDNMFVKVLDAHQYFRCCFIILIYLCLIFKFVCCRVFMCMV